MKYMPSVLIISSLWLGSAAMQATSVEHPGILHKDDNCSSCHTQKIRGKSVHSAMAISCTICHLAETRGDMTALNLAMPKEQICFACHEKSTELRQHSPVVKGLCVDCHDAHSSDRRMMLRKNPEARHSNAPPVGSRRD
jgi:predicted CXXCH cytochrome family protein